MSIINITTLLLLIFRVTKIVFNALILLLVHSCLMNSVRLMLRTPRCWNQNKRPWNSVVAKRKDPVACIKRGQNFNVLREKKPSLILFFSFFLFPVGSNDIGNNSFPPLVLFNYIQF